MKKNSIIAIAALCTLGMVHSMTAQLAKENKVLGKVVQIFSSVTLTGNPGKDATNITTAIMKKITGFNVKGLRDRYTNVSPSQAADFKQKLGAAEEKINEVMPYLKNISGSLSLIETGYNMMASQFPKDIQALLQQIITFLNNHSDVVASAAQSASMTLATLKKALSQLSASGLSDDSMKQLNEIKNKLFQSSDKIEARIKAILTKNPTIISELKAIVTSASELDPDEIQATIQKAKGMVDAYKGMR